MANNLVSNNFKRNIPYVYSIMYFNFCVKMCVTVLVTVCFEAT